MILIIDSGSTKMGWILLDGQEVKAHFVTKGFNPNYSDIQTLESLVETQLTTLNTSYFIASPNNDCLVSRCDKSASLQAIHYYGTGCGNIQNCQMIKEVFQNRFPDAEIHVTHDLMAACHALLGHEKGIACILGTGSNACVYDGENIVERAVSLGYLVGDEGSGMHVGKEVVLAYFYGFMPGELRQKFEAEYHLELKDFVQWLYHDDQPSRYLASFAKFAGENQHHPFVRDLVKGCFEAFLKAFVFRFDDCKTMKIGFVGSVAFHFKDILQECLTDHGLTMGEVMASPADGLVRYFSNCR